MFLPKLCIYLSLYFYVHIIVDCLRYYACFPRWVLNHLLGLVWEVTFGRKNLIPPRHLGIFTTITFNLCHPSYFPSNPLPLLIYVIPLGSVWEFIREWNRMEWNNHKGMERNGMYLSKGNEWNGMELTLIGRFKIKEWK